MSTKELIYNLDQKWKDATSFLDGPAYSLYNTEYYLLRNLFESMTGEEIKALLPGLRVDGPVYKLASSFLEGKRTYIFCFFLTKYFHNHGGFNYSASISLYCMVVALSCVISVIYLKEIRKTN